MSDEVCDAALHLDQAARGRASTTLLCYLPGPDFPTGGVLVDDQAAA